MTIWWNLGNHGMVNGYTPPFLHLHFRIIMRIEYYFVLVFLYWFRSHNLTMHENLRSAKFVPKSRNIEELQKIIWPSFLAPHFTTDNETCQLLLMIDKPYTHFVEAVETYPVFERFLRQFVSMNIVPVLLLWSGPSVREYLSVLCRRP